MQVMGKILAVLLFLATANSTWYFLGIAKFSVTDWIVFNACAVANITYLVGFLLFLIFNVRAVMYAALLPLFFFGGLGLFVFSWNGPNLFAQAGHILMVLNIVWAVLWMFRTGDFRQGCIGLLAGIAVFSVFIGFQQNRSYGNPEQMKRVGVFVK